jgi:hypothetical protein
MMHPLANFLCQMLFQQASKALIEKVLDTIKNDFCKIAIDQHGTRALQVLLDECVMRQKTTKKTGKILCESLEKGNRTLELMLNIRGNHVMKQCLQLMTPSQRHKQIYYIVFRNFQQLSIDKNGCQVV